MEYPHARRLQCVTSFTVTNRALRKPGGAMAHICSLCGAGIQAWTSVMLVLEVTATLSSTRRLTEYHATGKILPKHIGLELDLGAKREQYLDSPRVKQPHLV